MAVAVASIQRTGQYFNTTIFSIAKLPFIGHVWGITLKLQNICFQLGQTLKLSMTYCYINILYLYRSSLIDGKNAVFGSHLLWK